MCVWCVNDELCMFRIWSQNEVQAFWVDHNSDGVYHRLMQNCWLKNECQLELKSHDNHGRIYMKFLVFQKMQMKLQSKRPVIGMAKKNDSVVWVQAGWLDRDRWCRYPNAQINNRFFEASEIQNEKDRFTNSFWRNLFKMACSRPKPYIWGLRMQEQKTMLQPTMVWHHWQTQNSSRWGLQEAFDSVSWPRKCQKSRSDGDKYPPCD